ncbi:MAG: inositol monophosphatase [Legionella sp.]|nr:inositol monophosphatase [Legionella sp.]
MYQPLLNIAISAARAAGDLILRHLDQSEHLKLMPKDAHSFFTEVDVKAEQLIMQIIRKAYPNHGIIAEESGCHLLSDDTGPVWIIDPLDGTTNYVHGFPFFSISIAHKVNNRIEHGVVYDPLRQECFAASRGAGARLNDRRIRVSKQTQLSEALLSTAFPLRNPGLLKRYLPTLNGMVGQCGGIRRTGSAALNLAYVANGRLDGFWEFGLKTWDVAAGALLIREAGGLVAEINGGDNYLESGNLVAGTPKVFKTLIQQLQHCEKKG